MIGKLNEHYSLTNPASVYDEEALTALELVGRTTAKVNECINEFNKVDEETNRKLSEFEKVNIPATVRKEVAKQINDGTFDEQISESLGNLNDRVDALLGSVTEGSTTLDAEVIDTRTDASGVTHPNAGEAVRNQIEDLRSVANKKNLIDRAKLSHGFLDTYDTLINYHVYTNADAINRNYEYTTDYIAVDGGGRYYLTIRNALDYVATWARVCFYNYNKVKIADKSLNSSSVIVIPSDVHFVRISYRSGMLCDIKLEDGDYSTLTESAPRENVVDDYPLVFAGYISSAGQMVPATDAGYIDPSEPALQETTSEFVPVTAGEVYTVYNNAEKYPWFAVAFYDSDGIFVSRFSSEAGKGETFSFDVPDSAVTMRYCARIHYLDKLIVAKAGSDMVDYAVMLAKSHKPEEPNSRGYSSTVKGIAHRGLSSVAPENTLASIRAAAKAGFKYVEFDVRYTSDGIAILMHDDILERTVNGPAQGNDVALTTYGEIQDLEAGSWFSAEFYGEPIPTLDQAMALCMELGLHPYVEFKVQNRGAQADYTEIANKYGAESFTILTNDVTNCLVATSLGIRAGYLTSHTDPFTPVDNIGIEAGSVEGSDLSLVFYDWDATAWNSIDDSDKEMAPIGRGQVELWTVDDQDMMINADAFHVGGITSNTADASQIRYKKALEG